MLRNSSMISRVWRNSNVGITDITVVPVEGIYNINLNLSGPPLEPGPPPPPGPPVADFTQVGTGSIIFTDSPVVYTDTTVSDAPYFKYWTRVLEDGSIYSTRYDNSFTQIMPGVGGLFITTLHVYNEWGSSSVTKTVLYWPQYLDWYLQTEFPSSLQSTAFRNSTFTDLPGTYDWTSTASIANCDTPYTGTDYAEITANTISIVIYSAAVATRFEVTTRPNQTTLIYEPANNLMEKYASFYEAVNNGGTSVWLPWEDNYVGTVYRNFTVDGINRWVKMVFDCQPLAIRVCPLGIDSTDQFFTFNGSITSEQVDAEEFISNLSDPSIITGTQILKHLLTNTTLEYKYDAFIGGNPRFRYVPNIT